MEAFTLKGVWWLPSNPDHKVSGEVSFAPSSVSRLQLLETLTPEAENPQQVNDEPIILGVGENSQAITLVECLGTGSDMAWSDYIVFKPTYVIPLVLKGCHIDSIEKVSFETVAVEYYGMNGWASEGLSWGTIRPDDVQPIQSEPDNILLEFPEFNLKFVRGHSFSKGIDQFSVRRKCLIEFSADSLWKYKSLQMTIYELQMFLSLAMRTPTWPISITTHDPSRPKRLVSIHYRPDTDFRESDRIFRHFMYFTLEDVRPKLELCLRNWFANFDNLERVLHLYHTVISKRLDLEDEFLALARAIEVYHRQMNDEPYVSKEEYREIRKNLERKVKSVIPCEKYKDLRKRIYENLGWANSYSLRERLEDLQVRHHHQSSRLFEEFDEFIDDVVNTRNYLTHFVEESKSKARLDVRSLVRMRTQLRYLLELCLLSQLGLDDDELQHIIKHVLRTSPLPPRLETSKPTS